MNQRELYFDNVEVPIANLSVGPDEYNKFLYHTLAEANMFVGFARATCEHALEYAHELKQGGLPIIRQQNIKTRLFHIFRKIEAIRALLRRTIAFNASAPNPALQESMRLELLVH